MSKTLNLITICFILATFSELFSHHNSMISKNYPPPPATVDPGPDAALIKVRVIDNINGLQITATACINNGDQEPDNDPYIKYSLRKSANRHKGPIRFRELSYYFYTDGYFEVRVPPGMVTIEISKGYEFKPQILELEVSKKEIRNITISLEKSIDMPALGWYSGDTHIHMDRTGDNDDTLMTVTSAKDIQYAYLLSMNTEGYDKGEQYESWLQAKGMGDRSNAQKGNYYISSGQEYRTNRLGHITLLMHEDYVKGIGKVAHTDSGPSLGMIADQARDLGGFSVLNHGGYPYQEADAVLLEDKMDFLELLQFGGYRSLGLEGWYDFLNIGFRLAIVGACDFPYTRELGSEITYVWCDQKPSPRAFAEGLKEGKSFATSGPLLFLEVKDKKPGEILSFPNKLTVNLPVSIYIESPIYPVRYLELIVNGTVVERLYSTDPKSCWKFNTNLDLDESSWIAARTYAEAGTDAHTNPVYIYLNNKLPTNRHSLRQIITRLEGSIEAIPNRKIVSRLENLKLEIIGMLNGKKSNLPLPFIP